MEIPTDLIKQVQISLRRHANLPSYDPNDVSFSNLPSPEEAVAGLDRPAADLRCRHCEGALLRGSQSFICVFCGGEPFQDNVVPEPIAFRDSLASRWFLEFLSLDGSELVPVSVEANSRNRGRPATNNEIPLSDLLNLEIRWPSELEKFGSCLYKEKPVPSKASADFSSIVIQEKGIPYNASTGHNNLTLFETENTKESVRVQDNLDLFENAQSLNSAPVSTEDESWGESFQSAKESTSFGPFSGSKDLSAQLDEVFGAGKESSSLKRDDVANPVEPSSTGAAWFSDNSWNDPNSGLSGVQQETKVNTSVNSVDSFQDSSFDDWNDFAGSATPQIPSDSSKANTIRTEYKPSEMSLFGSPDAPHDIFSQQVLFPEEPSGPKISALSRTSDDILAVETPSKCDDVEAILSQMDDLSFMLDTSLSIPPRQEQGLNSSSEN